MHDYSKWKGWGGDQFSRLWFIDDFGSHVKGCVTFETDKLSVWLVHGQDPRMLGLHAADIFKFKLKVTVIKQDGGKDVMDVGTICDDFDESSIDVGCDGWLDVCGHECGTISCSDLEAKGFVTSDSVLLRFEIVVL